MRVVVAGGTGLAGRHVVEELTARGHEAVVVARSRGVDLLTCEGLDAALDAADVVIDVTNRLMTKRKEAESFFETAGRHLLAAEERAGVGHHVALSIVGVDRVGLGYYQGKLRQEEVVATGRVPWTVLRATQFHDFADQALAMVPGPVALVPRTRCRPVAVREVAVALVELAVGQPAGMAPEIAGPREESLPDMVRRLLRARGVRRPVLAPRLPGAVGRSLAGGGLVPTGDGPRGVQTFDAWLAGQTGRAPGNAAVGSGRKRP